jgi:hypothetical protein
MKRIIKFGGIALVLALALMQLANPSRINPPVVSDLIAASAPPPRVAALLHAACYDCHSNETQWPWYSRVAPISWLVAHDVTEGRQHLNFSEWPRQSPDRAGRRLDAISDEVNHGDMPPGKYTAIHAEARLTKEDRKLLADWADAESDRVKPSTPAK